MKKTVFLKKYKSIRICSKTFFFFKIAELFNFFKASMGESFYTK